MSREMIANRLRFLVYGDNAWRLTVQMDSAGIPTIVFDAHGMRAKDAKKALEDIVRILYSVPISLKVIHGYRRGTAIKDMLSEETFNDRLISKQSPVRNPGVTIMQLRNAA